MDATAGCAPRGARLGLPGGTLVCRKLGAQTRSAAVTASDFIARANEILALIERYAPSSEPIGSRDLDAARTAIEVMRDAVQSGRVPDRRFRYRALTRMIVDQWPAADPLGVMIAELEAAYEVFP